jgi:hypothetical protein
MNDKFIQIGDGNGESRHWFDRIGGDGAEPGSKYE